MSSLVLLKKTVEDEGDEGGGRGDDDRKTDSTCTNPYVINWKKARISPGCKIASVGQLQSQHRAFFKSKKKNKATLSL